MRTLLLSAEIRTKIQSIVRLAITQPIPAKILEEIARTGERKVRWRPYQIAIPIDYECNFSVEEHPTGFYRRLAISENNLNDLNIPALQLLLKEFGFKNVALNKQNALELMQTGPEEFGPNRVLTALIITQPILDVKGNA